MRRRRLGMTRLRPCGLGASLALVVLLGGCRSSSDPVCSAAAATDGVYLPPAGEPCTLLSSYGLFDLEGGVPVPNPNVVAYDVRTPLFSDYTEKYRMVWIPPGRVARYRSSGVVDLPVGTIVAKTFAMPADLRQPGARLRLLETRLLVRRNGGWRALSYQWDGAQRDAMLEPLGGRRDVEWAHHDGAKRRTEYLIPNHNQCAECHGVIDGPGAGTEIQPIGFQAKHLDRDYPYPQGVENQLVRLARLGLLTGFPASREPRRLALWADSSGVDLDYRVRSYFDINCAHCHQARRAASSSGLLLALEEEDPRLYGVCKTPIRRPAGQAALLVPGAPERSELYLRLASLDPRLSMPRVGRTVVHAEAIEAVAAWIRWLGSDEARVRLGLEGVDCAMEGPEAGRSRTADNVTRPPVRPAVDGSLPVARREAPGEPASAPTG